MTAPIVVPLVEAAGLPATVVGGKAAPLARLAAAGFPVPAGLVVTTAARGRVDEQVTAALLQALPGIAPDGELLAVRSSATTEDGADASYAGQYETFLNLRAEEVPDAVDRCLRAATGAVPTAYRAGRDVDPAAQSEMAVLVQVMVPAVAAGVAFTANPLTGDRAETVVTAVRGLGERLVSGQADGDHWTVRDGRARAQRLDEEAIDAAQAAAVAALGADVARALASGGRGIPVDLEWAIGPGGRLLLLQARPMTALPDPVEWTAPGPGVWMRNFRLGEWLPEPVTPLFGDWLLELLERGYLDGMRDSIGIAVEFPHALVDGWYYNTTPRPGPGTLVQALVHTRGRIVPVLYQALGNVFRDPVAADRAVLRDLHRLWQDVELPRYRRLVEEAEHRLETAGDLEDLDDLTGLVDRIGSVAGRQLWFLAVVGGAAWKMERCLARFAGRHLGALTGPDGPLADGVQVLVSGLEGVDTRPPPHAVSTVDWYRPTLGETGAQAGPPDRPERRDGLRAQREEAEAACLAALADPRRRRQFSGLLAVNRRYAEVREHQVRELTLGWPVLRAVVRRIGELLVRRGTLEESDDVFFLHRGEFGAAGAVSATARDRRARWQAQRRHLAPLTLGRHGPRGGGPLQRIAGNGRPGPVPAGAVVGQPASAGRVSGVVRVLTDLAEASSLRPGEVLVTPATTPAWTPLFATAAAVVTDSGALTAHASIVAREFGIPAVVGTADGTRRLRTGDHVVVDGSAGIVTPTSGAAGLRDGVRETAPG
ncbi:PEP/pyruvate-binding domain-containing protein [Kineococcus sp. SYSU DK003]|uniref:PEP/pyruvate-binding domain-containing protein n=1 Tax=Kineococcus sp. SYSU DK003 TaxID=3383124 RepID=UPI003D7CF568